MLISVIVPVYNAEKYIVKCLESLIEAKREIELEIILINDGSIDNSLRFCEIYSTNYSFISVISQSNSGPSSARNAGIRLAKGEHLVFVDADDYVEKSYLSELYLSVIQNNSDLACCGYYDHSEYGIVKATNYGNQLNYLEIKDFVPLVLDKVGGVLWDKIFRKEIIISNNILFNQEIRLSEDLLFVLEYLQYIDTISIVEKHLYHYNRIDQNGLSKVYDIKQYEYILKVNEIISNYLASFKVNTDSISMYLSKRKYGFLIQFCNNVALADLSFSKKILLLKTFRLKKGFDTITKGFLVPWFEYPVSFFLKLKIYSFVLYYCTFLSKMKSLKRNLQ